MSKLNYLHTLRISTRPNLASIFLQLPSSYRSFHASPQPQFVEASVSAAHSVFEGLHSITGLPWAYTIPLAALAIRTSIVLPVSIYSRRNLQKQVALAPLMAAWQHPLRKETMKEVGHLGPAVAHATLVKKTRRKSRELYKRFKCGSWRNSLPQVIQIPVWLTAIEALREMCGKEEGLLRMAAALFRSDDSTGVPAMVETGLPVEHSFATEGALWFPDLLAADPQMILPFMLSGAIIMNVMSSKGTSVWQKRITRSIGLVGLALGPLMLHVPSAMLIYWICSTTSAFVQAAVLDRLMPVKPPVVPCQPRRSKGLLEDLEQRS
ncbi:Cytochrome c oxidase assembly [Hyphodiscus hymeniophilus]|uniref:Cytochrome c oxidase assembly n=1 Tax=Hyphodiscus hymeniophilus TaxID=353542 RepID=A0A9P6VE80_9HELO|nr:Cytochrome c oxidase assembly [Hyphodiscus hymeniophilus]